jgi:hypothetical protein
MDAAPFSNFQFHPIHFHPKHYIMVASIMTQCLDVGKRIQKIPKAAQPKARPRLV